MRIRRVLAAVIFGVLSACSGEKTTAPVTVSSVSLTNTSGTLQYGQTAQLTASVLSANGSALTGRPLTWSSSNDAIASVSPTGLVTAGAVRGGSAETATITVTTDGKSASTAVTVAPIPASAVTLSLGQVAVYVGQTVQLGVTVKDATGGTLTGRAVTWSSASPTVATVTTQGLVTAIASGTAIISASVEGFAASAAVTISLVPVATVSVFASKSLVLVGDSLEMTAAARDSTGNPLTGRPVMWSSTAVDVATVNGQGRVTPVAIGTATITATVEGKSGATRIVVIDGTQDGLRAHFPFSNTVSDESGNDLSASANSFVQFGPDRFGRQRAALVLNDQGIVQLTGLELPQGYTYAAWIKPEVTPQYGTLITHRASLFNYMGTNESGCLRLYTSGKPLTAVSCNLRLVPGRWTHVAATFDGVRRGDLFIDGQLVASSTTLSPDSTGPTIARIGSSAGTDGFRGSLDDFRIYGRILRQDELAMLARDRPYAAGDLLRIAPESPVVRIGGTQLLTLQALDASGSPLSVLPTGMTWSSSNSAVATINPAGELRGVSSGTAVITAVLGSNRVTARVDVVPVPIARIALTVSNSTPVVGDSLRVIATAFDSLNRVVSSPTIRLAASDTLIARIDSDGMVRTLTSGTVTMTASLGVSTSITIEVRNPRKLNQPAFGSRDKLDMVTSPHFAIWWDKALDRTTGARTILVEAERAWSTAIDQWGVIPIPQARDTLLNVYLTHNAIDRVFTEPGFPQGCMCAFPDRYGIESVVLNYPNFLYGGTGGLRVGESTRGNDHTITGYVFHELFHVFQFGLRQLDNRNSYWFIEASANWFMLAVHPNDEHIRGLAATFRWQPQLPLWATHLNQTTPTAQLKWPRTNHHYGASMFLDHLVRSGHLSAQELARFLNVRNVPNIQRHLFDQLALRGRDLRTIYAQFAAQTSALDFFKADVHVYYDSLFSTPGPLDSRADDNRYVRQLQNAGIDWTVPPAEVAPAAWAYSVYRVRNSQAASYALSFAGGQTGTSGTASAFIVTVALRTGTTWRYERIPLSGNLRGGLTLTLKASDEEFHVVTASVPMLFETNEQFPYQLRITRTSLP